MRRLLKDLSTFNPLDTNLDLSDKQKPQCLNYNLFNRMVAFGLR